MVRCASSGSYQNPALREAAKRLSAIFYDDAAEGDPHPPASGHLGRDPNAPALAGPSPPAERPAHRPCSGPPPPPPLLDLPLWRADSVVLVGQQALLHVHTPHYVHMFDRLFASSRHRPWLFGHVRLPAGSRNLGAPEWALCAPGSRAPTVGTLLEVNRAVRLEDGKIMVLATALCRIQVRECRSETPYSRARVDLLHEDELLEAHHVTGMWAALDIADVALDSSAAGSSTKSPVDSTAAAAEVMDRPRSAAQAPASPSAAPVLPAPAPAAIGAAAATGGGERLQKQQREQEQQEQQQKDPRRGAAAAVRPAPDTALRAAAVAAQAATSASTWRWLDYEASAARAAAWLGGCPAEGADPADTRRLVSELVDHGVLSVVPFADGPVAGRWDLAALRAAAEADATAAAAAATVAEAAAALEDGAGEGPGCRQPALSQTGVDVMAGASDGRLPGDAGKGPGAGDAAGEDEARRGGPEAQGGAAAGTAAAACGDAADHLRPQRGRDVAGPPGPDTASAGVGGVLSADAGGVNGAAAAASGSGAPGEQEEGLTGHTTYDLLLLEARLWAELDALAVLQARANQQRLGLPLGLLQLRPSDELAAAQTAAAAPPSVVCQQRGATASASASPDPSLNPAEDAGRPERSRTEEENAGGVRLEWARTGSEPSEGGTSVASTSQGQSTTRQHGSAQPRVHPASEGLDVYCHPDYPLERRIARLSYAAAGIFIEPQDSESRQQLLEMPSVRMRLLELLRRARKARAILAAMAAVKALRP